MAARDIIVIGASSGGVHALREILANLPADLGAAVFIVQHQSPVSGLLCRVLDSATKLPVIAVDGQQKVHPGRVYVATPDVHMVVAEDDVLATRGARENRARPSINVLFRTAAADYGSRVIGVLLTGLLDDGVAGLEAIKRCGGLVIVQDPDDAEFAQLPQHALDAVAADHVLPLVEIAKHLQQLVGQPAPSVAVPDDIAIEARLVDPRRSSAHDLNRIGEKVAFACPECGGPMWRMNHGNATHFRCHTGHALSARTLLDSQAEEIEQSLWVAVRALTERAGTLEKLADRARGLASADGFRERAAEATGHAEQARQFLLSLRMTRPPDDSLNRPSDDDDPNTLSGDEK